MANKGEAILLLFASVLAQPNGCGQAEGDEIDLEDVDFDVDVEEIQWTESRRVRDSERPGMARSPDPYAVALRALARDAPRELLSAFLEVPDPAARAALASLVVWEQPRAVDLVAPLLEDESEIYVSRGCIGEWMTVFELRHRAPLSFLPSISNRTTSARGSGGTAGEVSARCSLTRLLVGIARYSVAPSVPVAVATLG